MQATTLEQPPLAADFTLPSHGGGWFHLAEALGPSGLILVFYRGHWCPYCRRYLAKLQANFARFHEAGIALAAISPEPLATATRLAAQLSIAFPLLSDSDGTIIDRFGVRNGFGGVATPPRTGPVLPHPAVFLFDATGMIRFKSIDRNFKRRTTMHALFDQVRKMK